MNADKPDLKLILPEVYPRNGVHPCLSVVNFDLSSGGSISCIPSLDAVVIDGGVVCCPVATGLPHFQSIARRSSCGDQVAESIGQMIAA